MVMPIDKYNFKIIVIDKICPQKLKIAICENFRARKFGSQPSVNIHNNTLLVFRCL